MSTNYYTLDGKHIGKTCAGSLYCDKCDVYYLVDVKKCVHCGGSLKVVMEFIWQLGDLGNSIEEIKKNLNKRKYVKNEYGEKLSIKEFWDLFKDVRIEEVVEDEFV